MKHRETRSVRRTLAPAYVGLAGASVPLRWRKMGMNEKIEYAQPSQASLGPCLAYIEEEDDICGEPSYHSVRIGPRNIRVMATLCDKHKSAHDYFQGRRRVSTETQAS